MREKRFFKLNKVDKETRQRIVEDLNGRLSSIKGLVFAYLHGSFAEGGNFRDIDIAIYTSFPARELEFESDLSYELTEKTGYPVEIKVINKAPVAFQMAVLRKGRVLFSTSDEIRTDFIENAGRRFREYIHFRNIMMGT